MSIHSGGSTALVSLEQSWAALGPGLAEMVRRAEKAEDASAGLRTLRNIWEYNPGLRVQLRQVFASLVLGAVVLAIVDHISGG